MADIASYLLANSYGAVSPIINVTSTINGASGNTLVGGFLIAFVTFFIFVSIAAIISIIAMWKIFTKAGQPGWASIIPVYNMIVMLEVIRRPLWWIVLMFIPFVNILISVVIARELARVFGKGRRFTAGLLVLPFIYYPLLGFGKSQYVVPENLLIVPR